MTSTTDWIASQLDLRQSNGQYRSLYNYQGLIDFCSNDYLGIARDGVLNSGIQNHLARWKGSSYGSTGSRLISGHANYHDETELAIAQYHGAPKALLFDNGYSANSGIIDALGQKGVDFVLDAHCHASMISAAHASNSDHVYKFRHNDYSDLETKLRQCSGRKIVMVESVYSMDGDTSDINTIIQICAENEAQLIIDEAHAFGWMGPNHIGSIYSDPNEIILAKVYTYGKGAGCHGAAVVSSKSMRDFLINFCKPFVYSTATTAHLCAAILASYECILQDPSRSLQLHEIIRHWNEIFTQGQGIFSPIQIIKSGDAKIIAAHLIEEGIGIKAIVAPTVPAGSECLRVCLHSFQNQKDMQLLQKTLQS